MQSASQSMFDILTSMWKKVPPRPSIPMEQLVSANDLERLILKLPGGDQAGTNLWGVTEDGGGYFSHTSFYPPVTNIAKSTEYGLSVDEYTITAEDLKTRAGIEKAIKIFENPENLARNIKTAAQSLLPNMPLDQQVELGQKIIQILTSSEVLEGITKVRLREIFREKIQDMPELQHHIPLEMISRCLDEDTRPMNLAVMREIEKLHSSQRGKTVQLA